MATTPQNAPGPQRQELKIISHSNLFYWWPVWAVGFLMGILTMIQGTVLAVVPDDTVAVKDIGHDAVKKNPDLQLQAERVGQPTVSFTDVKGRAALLLPKDFPKNKEQEKLLKDPKIHVSSSKGPGVVFFTVLLLVIFITNVPLRGLWSVLVIVAIILVATLLAVFGVWDTILEMVGLVDIRVSMAGYLIPSIALLILWLVAFFFFDPKVYMLFSPGQIRYCLEIGDAEHVIDATGISVRKQRDDIFRHWVLGLGSGDLIVSPPGGKEVFDLPNVLFVGGKLKVIEEMLRSRSVVAGVR